MSLNFINAYLHPSKHLRLDEGITYLYYLCTNYVNQIYTEIHILNYLLVEYIAAYTVSPSHNK